jgi:hypothetical protein
MANPSKQNSQLGSANDKPMIAEQQDNVADVIDALAGATLTGDTLTTSAIPTVTELEANDGVLGGKINAILAILEAHGLMADS